MDIYKTLIQVLLQCLDAFGIHPFKKMRTFLVCIGMGSIATILILNLVHLIFMSTDFRLFTDYMDSFFIIAHMAAKCFAMMVKRNEVQDVFQKSRQFYSIEEFDADFQKECRSHISYTFFIVQTFRNFCIACMLFYICWPMFGGDVGLKGYIPPFIPYMVFVVVDGFIMAYGAVGLICFDIFAYVMIQTLFVQFKMFNMKISSLDLANIQNEKDEESCLREIQSLVEYHNFLFSFLEKVNSIISDTFLFHFIVSNASMCFELYLIVTYSSLSIVENIKRILHIIGLIVQMLIYYCVPSTLLTDEASKTLNTIYGLQWYECKSMRVRKMILIIMQRVQRDAVISAGRLFIVNMEAGTKYFKTSLSFFTSLSSITD